MSHLVVLLKSDFGVQQTHICGGLVNKSSDLAAASGMMKLIIITAMILVTLSCDA